MTAPRRDRVSFDIDERTIPGYLLSTANDSMPRLPKNVVTLGIASLLNDVSSEMIFPLLPVFLTAVLGAGPLYLGFVEGAADSMSALLRLRSGSLFATSSVRRKDPARNSCPNDRSLLQHLPI